MRLAAFALSALTLLGSAGFLLARTLGATPPEEAVQTFLADWAAGRDTAAARRTDQTTAAARGLAANRRGLDDARLETDLIEVVESEQRARARFKMTWRIPRIGKWSYSSHATLTEGSDGWRVAWTPKIVHPELDRHTRLGTTSVPGRRGTIKDRAGRPLMEERRVVRVGAVVKEVDDPAATSKGLANLVGADAGALEATLRNGGPKQFVEAVALREEDFREIRSSLGAVPDATSVVGTAILAPSREFGRALLGSVAPATKEQLDKLGDRYAPGDSVGQWGLQAQFEERLGAVPDRSVVIRAGGVPIETLFTREGRPGHSVSTTIDREIQTAAEYALSDQAGEAAIIALDPSSGDLLAVANRPVESTYNRALQGTYPPGSTFKVVSTAALLRAGLSIQETVDCPATIDAGGRLFKNFEGSAQGSVPFSTDFSESCNTAFVSLANRLKSDALTRVGRDYGLGRSYQLGVEASNGQVPPGRDAVEQAASMIGQHEILASPLAMAGVAATVADGRWRSPRLLVSDPRDSGEPLDAGERQTLHELMQSVVRSGTGVALSAVPGEPAGKSGTAEYGGGDPPPTHAWFIAFRDDVALSVLVEKGSSGGAVAAPLAARFFEALDKR